MKALRVVLLTGLLVAMLVGTASCFVFPSVEYLGFNPTSFEYKYKVTTTPGDSFSFGYLELFTMVVNEGLTQWNQLGPEVGGVDQHWTTSWQTWTNPPDPRLDSAIWFTENPIAPSSWVGTFTLIAPNTSPTGNIGITMGTSPYSDQLFDTTVPGPAGLVPEPSALVALSTGLMGLGGVLFRRRKI